MAWVSGRQIPAQEWVAVYYDNPDRSSTEKLRCDTVVTVADDFVIPPNSEGVILTEIAGSMQSPARAGGKSRLSTPWLAFFNSLVQSKAYRLAENPVLRSISTTAIRTVTGTSKCMSRRTGGEISAYPAVDKVFTLAYCLRRKSSYNWPFLPAAELAGCAR
jgi:DNA gyrase inhibitor GyrI